MDFLPHEMLGVIVGSLGSVDRFARFGLVNRTFHAVALSAPLEHFSIGPSYFFI